DPPSIVETRPVAEPRASPRFEPLMTQNEPEVILIPISAPEESPPPGIEVPSLDSDSETPAKHAEQTPASPDPASASIPSPVARLWLMSALTVALWQAWRVMRFHRRLKKALPIPEWLASEVAEFAALLNVCPPRIAVLPG